MKTPIFPPVAMIAAISALSVSLCATSSALSQEAATFGAVPPPSNPLPVTGRVYLSSGAEDVLKLSRAKVHDDVIVAFIQNDSRRFSLSATEILHLRQEGVSDRVLTAMLGQRTADEPPPPPPPATTAEASAPEYTTPPETTAVVETVPSSTVYVATTPTYYSFYDPWPYWSSWYVYPAVSFGFYWGWGWGGCWGYPYYPSYCYPYPYYCNYGYWNNYCGNGNYPPPGNPGTVNGTRPNVSSPPPLTAEGRQPSGVSRERPLISEMRQPSGVSPANPGTSANPQGQRPSGISRERSITSETRQTAGANAATTPVAGARPVSGSAPAVARTGSARVENRTVSPTATTAQRTTIWSGTGNSIASRPTLTEASAPTFRSSQGSARPSATQASVGADVNSRAAAARPVGRTTTQYTRGNPGYTPASAQAGRVGLRPAASPTAGFSRSGSLGVSSYTARPSANYQRSSVAPASSFRPSPSSATMSRPSMGAPSRPVMSPSFSGRGSMGAPGMSSGGGFRGGGGGGTARPR